MILNVHLYARLWYHFSLRQINNFLNCWYRFVAYSSSSSVWIGSNNLDPVIYMCLPAAIYVVVYIGRHICILALFGYGFSLLLLSGFIISNSLSYLNIWGNDAV